MSHFNWLVGVASVFGLIQSLLWICFGMVGGLTYLCCVPVPPYKTEVDFFRVTFVKLYFEGPRCIPEGSYLGQFNEDYRKQMELFTPDKVFAVMTAYVILNVVYLVLSVLFYRNRRKEEKRDLALGWSVTTLVLCALDLALTYALVDDIFAIRDYMNKAPLSPSTVNLGEVSYVPLPLALISSRFIAIWLWNFAVGAFIFLNTLCCRNVIKEVPPKRAYIHEKKTETQGESPLPAEDQKNSSFRKINGDFRTKFDIRTHPNTVDYDKSTQGVTRFSQQKGNPYRTWSYAATEAYWHPKYHPGKDWEMLNEGYVSDEAIEPEKSPDFEHDLKNFESGKMKIKIVKPPIGKPVSIPVPPPLPPNGSCNC